MARRETARTARDDTPRRTPDRRTPPGGGRGAASRRGGVRPDPALGQNFLVDPAARRSYLRTVGTTPGLVYEVGAGEGALTPALARAADRLVAYEIDARLLPALRDSVADFGNVTCVRGDFLDARPPREEFAVAGNIPYNRTTDIVRWCLRARTMTTATLITQLEFAHKHTGRYGRWTQLSVLAWPRFELATVGRVARRSFRPAPRVDAGILRMRRRAQPLVDPGAMRAFEDVVRLGFTGRGGSLEATLSREYSGRAVRRALEAAGVARGTAVGFVSPTQWIAVFDGLRSRT